VKYLLSFIAGVIVCLLLKPRKEHYKVNVIHCNNERYTIDEQADYNIVYTQRR